MASYYAIEDILSVAAIHPFYNSSTTYPPDQDAIASLRGQTARQLGKSWSSWPLLRKDELYRTIERLCADESVDNTYRRSSYVSITGGGSGTSLPMLFLTDSEENFNQRIAMGKLMKACKMVEPSDWVLNFHYSGTFYRSLDLSTSTMELAGGSVLCGGHLLPHEKSVEACLQYRVNFLAGDAASLLNFAHHVETLPSSLRSQLHIVKIMYTSETMSRSKQDYLRSVFGPVSFFSCLGAGETGPWAVANLDWRSNTVDDDAEASVDFVFDKRSMLVEGLSLSADPQSLPSPQDGDWVSEGVAGHLVLTSLQRLRNPLVRYVSGDVGSLHPLSPEVAAQFPVDRVEHLQTLRLYGRDKRFSFKWLGDYYEFQQMDKMMHSPDWGVLQYQIILADDAVQEGSDCLELRMLRRAEGQGILNVAELEERLHDAFYLTHHTERLFRAVFLSDLNGFQRSPSSGKIIRFIDKRRKK